MPQLWPKLQTFAKLSTVAKANSTLGMCRKHCTAMKQIMPGGDDEVSLSLQCLLHMPQFMPEFRTFAVLSIVPKANAVWGMSTKHCNTMLASWHVLLWSLLTLQVC